MSRTFMVIFLLGMTFRIGSQSNVIASWFALYTSDSLAGKRSRDSILSLFRSSPTWIANLESDLWVKGTIEPSAIRVIKQPALCSLRAFCIWRARGRQIAVNCLENQEIVRYTSRSSLFCRLSVVAHIWLTYADWIAGEFLHRPSFTHVTRERKKLLITMFPRTATFILFYCISIVNTSRDLIINYASNSIKIVKERSKIIYLSQKMNRGKNFSI